MKQLQKIFLLSSLVIFLISCSGKDAPGCGGWEITHRYSAEELHQDFDQFRRIMEEETAGLYTDREKLNELLDEAETALKGSMNELDFYRVLAPVLAELRCGHSFLSVSECMEDYMRRSALYFPLTVRIVQGNLFVIDDPYTTGVEPGSEILRINGLPAREVIHSIILNMPTDGNDTGRPRYDAERWFAAMYYCYIDNPEHFVIDVVFPGNAAPAEIVLPGIRDASLTKTAMGVIHDTADSPWASEFHDAYALLRVPTFNLSNQKVFARSLKVFFAEVKRKKIDTLILDLRGNYGGTPIPTAELFTYLIDEPLPFFAEENPFYLNRWKKPLKPAPEAFGGQLLVLMDEAGFSMNSFLFKPF